MNALFLCNRNIVPLADHEPKDEGHGIMPDANASWYHTKYAYRAWAGMTNSTQSLQRMEDIARKCDLIVIYIGPEGLDILGRLLSLDYEIAWRDKRLVFVTSDNSLKVRYKLLTMFFPKADCIETFGNDTEMSEYMTGFLLTGADPRAQLEHKAGLIKRRLDPFSLRTRP